MEDGDCKVCLYQNLDSIYYDYLRTINQENCIDCKKDKFNLNCPNLYLVPNEDKDRRIFDDFKIWRRSLEVEVLKI